jgi:hypothetical protein
MITAPASSRAAVFARATRLLVLVISGSADEMSNDVAFDSPTFAFCSARSVRLAVAFV